MDIIVLYLHTILCLYLPYCTVKPQADVTKTTEISELDKLLEEIENKKSIEPQQNLSRRIKYMKY